MGIFPCRCDARYLIFSDILDSYIGARMTFTYGYRSVSETSTRILSSGSCYPNDLSKNLIYSNGTCRRVTTLA